MFFASLQSKRCLRTFFFLRKTKRSQCFILKDVKFYRKYLIQKSKVNYFTLEVTHALWLSLRLNLLPKCNAYPLKSTSKFNVNKCLKHLFNVSLIVFIEVTISSLVSLPLIFTKPDSIESKFLKCQCKKKTVCKQMPLEIYDSVRVYVSIIDKVYNLLLYKNV